MSGRITGGQLVLSVSGSALAHTNSFELSMEQDLPEATSMDSNQWAEFIAGERTWSLSVEGLTEWAAGDNVELLVDLILDQEKVDISFTTGVTGEIELSGEAFASGLTLSASRNEAATYSGDMQGTGPIEKATVA